MMLLGLLWIRSLLVHRVDNLKKTSETLNGDGDPRHGASRHDALYHCNMASGSCYSICKVQIMLAQMSGLHHIQRDGFLPSASFAITFFGSQVIACTNVKKPSRLKIRGATVEISPSVVACKRV